MSIVLVTEPEYRKAEAVFRGAIGLDCRPAPADEDDLALAVANLGVAQVVVGTQRYTGALYQALPPGGVIARFGVGHDGLDKAAARARGILCCNTPGVLDATVAECAIGLMLALARHLAACRVTVVDGWRPRLGRELSGATLAVVGCGGIGRRVAAIARHGLGMRTIGCWRGSSPSAGTFDADTDSFAKAVRDADVVSLHIPDLLANRRYLDATRLACLRRDAMLINTARGAVLDEVALYDAIAGGALAGAGLDVFEREPYAPVDPQRDLRQLPGVLMTPHLGSSTHEACTRMAQAALRNLALAIAGRCDEMDLVH